MKILTILLCALAMSAQAQQLTEEQEIVAKTLLGEARGEGYEGMYAVACVIQQRVINRHRGAKTAKSVCLDNNGEAWQFSCWNPADPNFNKLDQLLKSHDLAPKAKALAIHLHALDRAYVKHADHYARDNIDNYWTRAYKHVSTVGRHKFYRKGE